MLGTRRSPPGASAPSPPPARSLALHRVRPRCRVSGIPWVRLRWRRLRSWFGRSGGHRAAARHGKSPGLGLSRSAAGTIRIGPALARLPRASAPADGVEQCRAPVVPGMAGGPPRALQSTPRPPPHPRTSTNKPWADRCASSPSTATASPASRPAPSAARSADPAANAAAILESRADVRRRGGARWRSSRNSRLSGYAIDDLLLQDALLDAVERGGRRCWRPPRDAAAGAGRRRAAAPRRPALQHARWSSIAAGCSASCRRSYLPNYREFYEKRQFASGDGARRATIRARRPGGAVRRRPAVRGRGRAGLRRARRDLRGLLGAGAAERHGGAGRRHGAAEPLRQQHHHRQGRDARGCSASRSRRAASPPISMPPPGAGESTTDLAWDGQASIFENGAAAGRDRALPGGRRRSPSPTSISTCCGRSACAGHLRRQPPQHAPAAAAFRRVRFRLDPPDGRSRAASAPVERFPFVPGRPGAARPGLLRGLQHPGRRPGAAAAARPASSASSSASRAASIRPRR